MKVIFGEQFFIDFAGSGATPRPRPVSAEHRERRDQCNQREAPSNAAKHQITLNIFHSNSRNTQTVYCFACLEQDSVHRTVTKVCF